MIYTATLVVFAMSGFWAVPEGQSFRYPDMAACEAAREFREREARDKGGIDVYSICRPFPDRGA